MCKEILKKMRKKREKSLFLLKKVLKAGEKVKKKLKNAKILR